MEDLSTGLSNKDYKLKLILKENFFTGTNAAHAENESCENEKKNFSNHFLYFMWHHR